MILITFLYCLEEMSLNMGCEYNDDTSAKATSFYKLMTFSDFLSSLVITMSFPDLIHSIVAVSSNRYCWCNTSYQIIENSYLLQTLYCWYLSYFPGGDCRSEWAVLYKFWTHVILTLKLGQPGKKHFLWK